MVNYNVNNIYPCVQGEGCLTGVPMIMLRLHGCSVGCSWCDTKETWYLRNEDKVDTIKLATEKPSAYASRNAEDIVSHVRSVSGNIKWVLLSGGEPAEQELKVLVKCLHDNGYKVAIETSGTANGLMGAGIDWVCVSPKIDMAGGKQLDYAVLGIADEIKMVIGTVKDIDKLKEVLSKTTFIKDVTICLQPVSMSPKATEICIAAVMENGWRLSIQTHKLLNIP